MRSKSFCMLRFSVFTFTDRTRVPAHISCGQLDTHTHTNTLHWPGAIKISVVNRSRLMMWSTTRMKTVIKSNIHNKIVYEYQTKREGERERTTTKNQNAFRWRRSEEKLIEQLSPSFELKSLKHTHACGVAVDIVLIFHAYSSRPWTSDGRFGVKGNERERYRSTT